MPKENILRNQLWSLKNAHNQFYTWFKFHWNFKLAMLPTRKLLAWIAAIFAQTSSPLSINKRQTQTKTLAEKLSVAQNDKDYPKANATGTGHDARNEQK